MDLQLFHSHSLITRDQSSHNQYNGYLLHSLHVAYLRHQNWTEIQQVIFSTIVVLLFVSFSVFLCESFIQYRQECVDKIRSQCCGKWFLVDNTDGILWKILFQCCKLLYKRPDDFPFGLVTDLRVWNAYGRARGKEDVMDEIRRCIEQSSSQLRHQL